MIQWQLKSAQSAEPSHRRLSTHRPMTAEDGIAQSASISIRRYSGKDGLHMTAKIKTCKVCDVEFEPRKPLQQVCGLPCAVKHSRQKATIAAEKTFDAETQRRRAKILSRPEHVKAAQTEFNKFIRARDRGLPCISCGATTGQFQAGHYRPASTQSALRFNVLNVNVQCATCNNHRSGNLTGYRIGLIAKIGIELVEWLERDHSPERPDIEELKWIRKHYQQKAKELS